MKKLNKVFKVAICMLMGICLIGTPLHVQAATGPSTITLNDNTGFSILGVVKGSTSGKQLTMTLQGGTTDASANVTLTFSSSNNKTATKTYTLEKGIKYTISVPSNGYGISASLSTTTITMSYIRYSTTPMTLTYSIN